MAWNIADCALLKVLAYMQSVPRTREQIVHCEIHAH